MGFKATDPDEPEKVDVVRLKQDFDILEEKVDVLPFSNLDGEFVTVTSPAIINTQFPVAHSLNRVANGYIVVHQDTAARVYDDHKPQRWATDRIFVKCDIASTKLKFFIF